MFYKDKPDVELLNIWNHDGSKKDTPYRKYIGHTGRLYYLPEYQRCGIFFYDLIKALALSKVQCAQEIEGRLIIMTLNSIYIFRLL